MLKAINKHKPTSFWVVLLIVCVGSWGLASQSAQSAVAFAFSVMAALCLMGTWPAPRRLKLTVEKSGPLQEGHEQDLVLKIRSDRSRPCFALQWEWPLGTAPMALPFLWSRCQGRVRSRYHRRGVYRLNLKYKAWSFFGLYRIEGRFESHDELVVWPQVLSTEWSAVAGEGQRLAYGSGSDDTQMWAPRMAQPGDRPSRYLWPLSSRVGEWVTRSGSSQEQRFKQLTLDLRGTQHVSDEVFERSLSQLAFFVMSGSLASLKIINKAGQSEFLHPEAMMDALARAKKEGALAVPGDQVITIDPQGLRWTSKAAI